MTLIKPNIHSHIDNQDEAGKLFVGGLSWETTKENLQHYFGKYGNVVDCVVMKNNETGRSRGFGFVTFSDPNCVAIVLASGPHELDSRTIDPKACNPREIQKMKKSSDSDKVFLGGLPPSVTESDIRDFFSKYGTVTEVVIMFDQEKKKSRGFGFLSFESEDSIRQVCSEHYVTINNKQVECKRAEPRNTPRGGNRFRKDNGGQNNQWNSNAGESSSQGHWEAGGNSSTEIAGADPNMGNNPSAANGMMTGSYQGGWGQQQASYNPQTGWGSQAQTGGYASNTQSYGANYFATGAPGYGSYGNPGQNFGQQGYGGYGPPNYGTNNQISGAPSGSGASLGPEGYSTQGAGPQPPQSVPNPNSGGGGGYSQETSNYGPIRGVSGGFGGPNAGYSGQSEVPGSHPTHGNQQPQQQPPQGYHPYRR